MARRDPEDDTVALVAAVVEHIDQTGEDPVAQALPYWASLIDGRTSVNDLRSAVDAALAERWMRVSPWPKRGEPGFLTIELTEEGKTVGRKELKRREDERNRGPLGFSGQT